ncbi:MAG: response regulator [Rhodoferax sp.]|nr:response regulator [Rhodoferax sp.]
MAHGARWQVKTTSSIRYKFLTIVFGILIVSAVVLSTVVAISEGRMLSRSLETKGQSFASYVALLSEDPLVTRDTVQLDNIVSVANKDEDIVFTVIYDADGKLLTSQFAGVNYRSPRLQVMLEDMPKNGELESIIEHIRSHHSDVVTEIVVPVVSGAYTIGRVVTCLSRYNIQQEIRNIVLSVLLLNVVVALVLALVLFTVSRKLIFDPIANLAIAIARLAKGDLSTRITSKATGEVLALFKGFNTMAEDLNLTTVSKDYFDNILSSMTNTLIVVSLDNRIVKVNMATCALLGYTEQELVGQPFDMVASEPNNRQVDNIEDIYRAKTGQKVPVLLSASVMHDADQNLCGMVYVAQDITALKEIERSLKEAKDIAESASKAKTLFLAHMSHEIRTPMNGILGMTELLLGTPLTAQQKRFVDAAYHSGKNLLDIINAILDFSKIEAGKLELELTDFNLRQMVEDIGSLFATQAAAKAIHLMCLLPDELPVALHADQVRLRQVLTNLIGNAIKFTQEGEVSLEIQLTAQTQDTARLRFEVRDTGIGISQEAQQRIFDAFAQADNTTTRRFGGTGLGLSISRLLIGAMGGQLQVSSAPGSGSRFWFEVVLGKQCADARVLEDSRFASQQSPAAPHLLKGRVLVAEDHPVNQELVMAMLEKIGVEAVICGNGREALVALDALERRAHFDVILMDCQMPEMDGFTATAAIRAKEQNSAHPAHIPIIALTANALSSDRDRCLAAGMDDYLSKPFTQDQLCTTLARWLAPSSQQEAPEPPKPSTPSLVRTQDNGTLNVSALKAIRQLDPQGEKGLLAKVVRSYLRDANQRLNDLQAAVQASDAQMLRKVAHAMKSASANVGADRLAARFKELEALAQAAKAAPGEMLPEGAQALVTSLMAEYDQVAQALQALEEMG